MSDKTPPVEDWAQLDGAMPAEQRLALDAFWRLLLTWNARINLTGAQDRKSLEGEHLPDALAMARLVPEGARVVDVGAGGGLPGIPFAILRPDVALTLVEPRAKRVAFLRTAVREGKLSAAEVVAGRLGEVKLGEFDVASSRATFAPAEWLAAARPLARRVLVFAARRTEVEEGAGLRLERELAYATAARHPRWLGLFCST
jgi:16S rRNA (guanine527-N7)-methyltransferase